jgi:hypothetical protein
MVRRLLYAHSSLVLVTFRNDVEGQEPVKPRLFLLLVVLGGVVPLSALETETLLLFGGRNHEEFLGCLNCSPFDASSVCNSFGRHGNPFMNNSIWNSFGKYGNQFLTDSPWNQFASRAPVIVDGDGNFYGYFTKNELMPKRTRIQQFVQFLDVMDPSDLDRSRKLFCSE